MTAATHTEVLDPQVHAPILRDFEHVCATAGVQPRFMRESMKMTCGPVEVDWVRRYKLNKSVGNSGLLLLHVPNPDSRCQAICAALVRNFIDARNMPLNTVLSHLDSDTMPSPSVLCIPNFYVHQMGKGLPAFKIQQMYDLLVLRASQNKLTVVYVENMPGVTQAYGAPLADFLTHFTKA